MIHPYSWKERTNCLFCLFCHQNCSRLKEPHLCGHSSASIIWFLKLETCVLFRSDKRSMMPHDWLNSRGSHTKWVKHSLSRLLPRQWYSPPKFSLMNLQYMGCKSKESPSTDAEFAVYLLFLDPGAFYISFHLFRPVAHDILTHTKKC